MAGSGPIGGIRGLSPFGGPGGPRWPRGLGDLGDLDVQVALGGPEVTMALVVSVAFGIFEA